MPLDKKSRSGSRDLWSSQVWNRGRHSWFGASSVTHWRCILTRSCLIGIHSFTVKWTYFTNVETRKKISPKDLWMSKRDDLTTSVFTQRKVPLGLLLEACAFFVYILTNRLCFQASNHSDMWLLAWVWLLEINMLIIDRRQNLKCNRTRYSWDKQVCTRQSLGPS